MSGRRARIGGRIVLTAALATVLLVLAVGRAADALTTAPASPALRQEPAPSNSQPPVESGIVGQAVIANTCPGPIRPGQSCGPSPYQAWVTILDTSSQPILRFQTEPDGAFRVALQPGDYVLHPESPGRLPYAPDQSVTVLAEQFTQVEISYDSGMR